MALEFFIGIDELLTYHGAGAEYVFYERFQAAKSGILSELRIYGGDANSAVKLAIYADDGGGTPRPSSLLATASGNVTVHTQATLALSANVTLVKDSYYWIGSIGATTGWTAYEATGGTIVYKGPYTFSSFSFPTTYDNTGFSAETYRFSTCGWGTAGLSLAPSAIASTLAFGATRLTLKITPSGITGAAAFGTARLNFKLSPSTMAGTTAFGAPSITQGTTIAPSGISSTAALGTPSLKYNQVLNPSPRAPAAAFGTPSLFSGNITCTGIASAAVFGSPTVARFVFHVILEAHYSAEAPDINRAYIIGQDSTGADVSGNAITQADVDLVGERLEVRHEISIPTAAVASAVAAAILAAARMDGKRGTVTIPPHCGLELWDVLSVLDEVANQSTAYRVSGYVLEYDTRQGIYRHTLELCAP